MPSRSTLTGGAAIARKFKAAVPGLLPAISEASRASLKPMLAAARENVPVRSGALKKSLAVKKLRSARLKPSYAVGPRSDYVGKAGQKPVRYAHLAEFGRPPNADGKGEEKGTRFLTRAFRATASEALRIFEQTVGPAFLKRLSK